MSNDNSDNDYPSIKKDLIDNNYLLNKKKSTNKTIRRMKEKYGGTENFVKEGTHLKEKNLKVESKDNSSSSKELKKIDSVSKTKEKNKKRNKNGKVGINKHNNYAPDMYAPRKVFSNHLPH